MKHRASWDEYFMRIAEDVATRATCDRKHVGAVIVRDKSILATGYNGSIRGLPHCDEDGHLMEDGHCVRTIHAEANAVIQAARNGVRIEGGTVYVTASPCWGCFKMIANAGLVRIVFGEFYRDERIFQFATRLGIELSPLHAEPDEAWAKQAEATCRGRVEAAVKPAGKLFAIECRKERCRVELEAGADGPQADAAINACTSDPAELELFSGSEAVSRVTGSNGRVRAIVYVARKGYSMKVE
jgi:dCMP deaminase